MVKNTTSRENEQISKLMKQCPHCGEMRPHWTEEDEKRRREQKEKEVRI